MCNKAAMWKLHTRTKEIRVFKPSPCKRIASKALKSATLFRVLLKENQLCLVFSSPLPSLNLSTKLLLTTISQGRSPLEILFIEPAEIWLANEDQ